MNLQRLSIPAGQAGNAVSTHPLIQRIRPFIKETFGTLKSLNMIGNLQKSNDVEKPRIRDKHKSMGMTEDRWAALFVPCAFLLSPHTPDECGKPFRLKIFRIQRVHAERQGGSR